ncbi:MAG: oligosaccharide flippase family protein [Bacteroidota bacterium]
MDGRRASRNAVVGATQTLLSAALLFVFYRRILDVVGADGLGVWSVVLATTGVARIGDLGLTGSAVKFAAGRVARGADDEAARVIETTVVSVALLGLLLAGAGYVAARALLPVFIPEVGLEAARTLLPFAFVSLWFALVSGAVQSGLDGTGRLDLRNGIVFLAQVAYVGLGWVWVASDGLVGLAVAQVVQGALIALLCWFALRRVLQATPLVPWRWDRALFREMLAYSLQYQALSLTRLLYEPVTKALMSRFGGLEAAGYYEMATLVWTKLRSLVIAAQQALTPEIAMLEESRPEAVNEVYRAVNGLNWYLSVPLFAGIIAAAPLLSTVWIGRYEEAFVVTMALLGVGWFANALSGPGFFVFLGTGQMGGLVASHLTTGVVNAVGGVILGWALGGAGVTLAWTLGLALGALHLLLRLDRDRGIRLAVPPNLRILALVAVVALGLAGGLVAAEPASLLRALGAVGIVGAGLALPVWRLPYRERLMGVLRRGIGASA